MKPHTLLRGAAISGAMTLLNARFALAANFGQNTPLHLGASTGAHTSAAAPGSIVRTIVGLAIVIAVIYGLSWILRHAKAAKNPALGTGLEQIASLPLGTGRSVSLVRVGSELHLLGVAEHGVSRSGRSPQDEAQAVRPGDHGRSGPRQRRGRAPSDLQGDSRRCGG